MVTKAIIKSINRGKTEAELYVPLYASHSDITGLSSTYTASISTQVGIKPQYQIGDVVYVCIEDNDPGKLVIMGSLYNQKRTSTISDATHGSLKVTVNAELPENTSIGSVSAANIKNLKNSRSNIQNQIDSNIKNQVELLDFMTDELTKFLTI